MMKQAQSQNTLIPWEYLIARLQYSVTVVDARDPILPLIYVNEHFTELTGYSVEESVGSNCRFLQGPETDRETVDKIKQAIQQQKATKVEILNYTKAGRKFWNELNIDPIFNEAGECLYFVGIQYDISERKFAEQQLQLAIQMAEYNARQHMEFIGKLSHEIRTPLNGIMNMIELAGMDASPQEQEEYLELAQQSAEVLLSFVNNSMDMAKLGMGKMKVEEVEFRPDQLLQQLFKIHQPAARLKQVELSTDIDPSLPEVLIGDPLRLRQILDNLLSNAIKFTESGRVQLQARLVKQHNESAEITFIVQDTGIGIPKSMMKSLFGTFVQADISHSRRFGGSGLGLNICKELAELMGGQIHVESEVDAGTTFTVELKFKSIN
ncbi:PAS domain-containing protein [Paenibacillus sp. F411]|uniref:sensor histidine kinase n=1 Tax=Paenibacillus sp. F411 TaxID=2820239 RepID=UPI001AAE8A5D|nr:ATP-binding protein [Paenibacillus sp. F411]MBO2942896.1 PAS domain-containing protein [Paenibacillus sp. F411]